MLILHSWGSRIKVIAGPDRQTADPHWKIHNSPKAAVGRSQRRWEKKAEREGTKKILVYAYAHRYAQRGRGEFGSGGGTGKAESILYKQAVLLQPEKEAAISLQEHRQPRPCGQRKRETDEDNVVVQASSPAYLFVFPKLCPIALLPPRGKPKRRTQPGSPPPPAFSAYPISCTSWYTNFGSLLMDRRGEEQNLTRAGRQASLLDLVLEILALDQLRDVVVVLVLLVLAALGFLHGLVALGQLAERGQGVGTELIQDAGDQLRQLLVFAVTVDGEGVGWDGSVNCRLGPAVSTCSLARSCFGGAIPLGAAKWMTLPSDLNILTSSIACMGWTFSFFREV